MGEVSNRLAKKIGARIADLQAHFRGVELYAVGFYHAAGRSIPVLSYDSTRLLLQERVRGKEVTCGEAIRQRMADAGYVMTGSCGEEEGLEALLGDAKERAVVFLEGTPSFGVYSLYVRRQSPFGPTDSPRLSA